MGSRFSGVAPQPISSRQTTAAEARGSRSIAPTLSHLASSKAPRYADRDPMSESSRITRRAVLAGTLPVALRAQQRPPNFLVIVADDHGWDDLGCYGHPVVQTPHLDRIAGEGVRFTRCFTAAPLCSPGR